MKYSLRSLMTAALVLPPLLAVVIFFMDTVIEWLLSGIFNFSVG